MQPYIGRWHCRYRVSQAQPDAAVAAGRLERAVRRRSLDAYSDSLLQAFENDPTVYIVRSVRQRLTLSATMQRDELTLARTWGERTCGAVVRAIVRHADDPGRVIRFADTAEYVAHFLADLVNGNAWQRWYYGVFSKYRLSTTREIVAAVLLEYRDQFAAILRCLARLGCLDAVLALLDDDTARAVWTGSRTDAAGARDPREHLVFVRAALDLIARLGLLAAHAPAEMALLSEYSGAGPPLEPHWADRRSLASAIVGVIRFATTRGYVVTPRTGAAAEWQRVRADVLAGLDWVDTEWLTNAVDAWLAEDADGARADDVRLPARETALTPAHRRILDAIRRVFEAGRFTWSSGANVDQEAMRLLAAVAAIDADLAGHTAAPSIIFVFVSAGRALMRVHDPGAFIDTIRSGARPRHAADLQQRERHALATMAALGAAAADVLVIAAKAGGGRRTSTAATTIESNCAGLFLLARAVLDGRLPQLCASVPGAPPLPAVLLALGLQWGGGDAYKSGAIDPGLALWAGVFEDPDPLATLAAGSFGPLHSRVRELMLERQAVDASLEVIETLPDEWTEPLMVGWPPDVLIDDQATMISVHLMRLWARWLPALGGSSVPYLLTQFIRRPGVIELDGRSIDVILRPGPMDVVLQMAGYLNDIASVPWLQERSVKLRIEPA